MKDILSFISDMSYGELEVLRDQIDLKMQMLDKELDVQLVVQADIKKNEFLLACAYAMLHQKWGIDPTLWRESHPVYPLAYYLAEHIGQEKKLPDSEKTIYDDIMCRFDLIKYIFSHTHYNYFSDGHYCRV